MLPSSVRRAIATVPSSSIVSSLASSAPRAAAAVASASLGHAIKTCGHQRRYSSSKPSNPNDGPRDYNSRPAVPAGSSKSPGEKRKRKAKEIPMPQLPSVPSTGHITGNALALSSFFALHRPISVTQQIPKIVTDEEFAEIFNPKPKGSRTPQDVISTLSRTVTDLEQPFAGKQSDVKDKLTKLILQSIDGNDPNYEIGLNTMSGAFLPFVPPPPPVPFSAAQAEEPAQGTAGELAVEEPRPNVYKAMVTITVDAAGTCEVTLDPQSVGDEAQDGVMQALSVKRIRKLKMKKMKYKKLMKRTRNKRRKLDRL